jgi:PAS domain S-box-containing protein
MQDSQRRLAFVVALPAFLLGLLAATLAVLRLWPEWRMVDEPLHAALEGFGGLIAIIFATFLLQRKREEHDRTLVFPALGLINMGLLDVFHAASTPGNGSVLLHSVGGLAGGLWFALVWICRLTMAGEGRLKRWAPWVVGAGACLLRAWTFVARETLPAMTVRGAFTTTAVAINVLAAMFFIFAAARLLLEFHRRGEFEIYLLACMAGVFGLANVMFPFSAPWNNSWWMWHLLRLAAYMLALGFTLHQYHRTVSDLNSELAQHEEDKDRLRTAEARYRTLFEQSPDGVVVIDAFTRLPLEYNEMAHRQLGYTRDEFATLRIDDYEAAETPEQTHARIDRLMRGLREDFETQHRTRQGELRNVLVTTQKLMLSSRAIFHCVFRDITDVKRAEQRLRAADEQLREQAALVRLGEMAAIVAHEVKNPLAGIRGAIQVIGGRLPPGSKDAAVIADVIARLDALDELMQDLLLFARPPQMRPAPVDVTALAKETVTLVSQDPAAQDVRFVVEGSGLVVIADAKLLQIVFLNLLLNAAQAVQSPGTVRMSITANHHGCRIAIADTGPGIPPEIRNRVFAPFFTTKSRGTGLGLSTAKRLVDAHHGRITVDCPSDGGTIITIELPHGHRAENAGAILDRWVD